MFPRKERRQHKFLHLFHLLLYLQKSIICIRTPEDYILALARLKGSVSQDFRPLFFHDSYPSGPLITGWNIFEFGYDFAEIFEFLKTPRCEWHRGVRLRSGKDTAESESMMTFSPSCQEDNISQKLLGVIHTQGSDFKLTKKTLLCHSRRGVRLRGVIDTVESFPPRSQNPKPRRFLVPL